jgi:hypothetical protein
MPTSVARKIAASSLKTTVKLIASAKAARGPVLVVGNSLSVQEIVAGLGGTPPTEIPFNFRKVWMIGRDGGTVVGEIPGTGPGCSKSRSNRGRSR